VEPEEDRAYGEHEVEDVDAVEPEVDRAHGEHEVVDEDAVGATCRDQTLSSQIEPLTGSEN
jgi:hypothetical protein